ncbi:acyl-CoA dehydrogenase family protein [Noviherbaspirillum sedimenti]|uniref:Isovaleryl-CoA dehydrogenase n=1 Tax=Noviherbaspirillum sedimenti TaxID=2320865 RepID=A0A3A3GK25_9BURK|nr:acyl-CoA dehydrogenase family protein [Noviherbaspirillum sedimenti]RJG02656.1 isovaleryl-CoA dehydrogenase [Noviherbaspirillum sedimenti]
MNFLLTEGQREFRAELRSWLQKNLPENWRNGRFVEPLTEAGRGEALRKWERKLYEAGYAGLHWPKEYGGHGQTLTEHFIFGEESGRVAAPEGINPIGRELVAGMLLHAGSEEQKTRLLPRIAACDDIWCQGFSEPNAGSDLTSLKTRAVQRDGMWIVTGQKIWTSYAQHADMCLLLVRTSTEKKNYQGLTLMAVPMTSPGITRRGMQQLDGTWDFNEVFFDEVAVPPENVLGPVGEGWAVSGAVLAIERATTRLYRQQRYLNELQHAYRIAKRRRPNIDESDLARQQIAEAYSQLLVLRALNVRFVGKIVAGEKVGSEASILKQCWSHFHQNSTGIIADLLGEDHWFPEEDSLGSERFMPVYFHSRAETIFAGTSEIQKDIIAERLLDLPRTR